MHFYVPESVARRLRSRARAAGLSISRYLASLVGAEAAGGWPESYFDEVVGGWKGKRLRRSSQGRPEPREIL